VSGRDNSVSVHITLHTRPPRKCGVVSCQGERLYSIPVFQGGL